LLKRVSESERVLFHELNESRYPFKGAKMTGKPVFFKLVFAEEDPNSPTYPGAEIHARPDGTYKRLTPKLTAAELDCCIDHLIEELEHIRQEGKRRFALAKRKTRA
jgi:hypothetical protein